MFDRANSATMWLRERLLAVCSTILICSTSGIAMYARSIRCLRDMSSQQQGPLATNQSDEQTTIPLDGVPAAKGPGAAEGGTPVAGPELFQCNMNDKWSC